FASFLATAPLFAQYGDVMALDRNGGAWLVDSSTGATRALGLLGISGCEALASDLRGDFWTTESAAGQQYLGTVTSWPVGYTRVHATPGGLVALAWNGTNVLHGLLVSATGALFLCDVDAQSGSVTPIGA